MVVWGVEPRGPHRRHVLFSSSCFFFPPSLLILLRSVQDLCGVPLRLGFAALHFSMLLSMLRTLGESISSFGSLFPISSAPTSTSMLVSTTTMTTNQQGPPPFSFEFSEKNNISLPSHTLMALRKSQQGEVGDATSSAVGMLVLAAGLGCFPFYLLGVWTGRTLSQPLLCSYHALSHLGSTGFLLWLWVVQHTSQESSMKSLNIFFYLFVLLPAVTEVGSVLFSVRRGLD